MDKMETQEMISALADGQLHGEALERAVQAVAADPEARAAWQTYHLIGDVLRSGELSTGTPPAAFLAGFQSRLERERELPVHAPQVVRPPAEAANDGSFRW